RSLPVPVEKAVARVLPVLVLDAGRALALELDEAIAVHVAALLHPLERRAEVRLELADEIALGDPTRGLRRKPHEERRRIDRPVVRRAEGAARPRDLALADLMRDTARLLITLGD